MPFALTLHRLDRAESFTWAIHYGQESIEGALSVPMEVR